MAERYPSNQLPTDLFQRYVPRRQEQPEQISELPSRLWSGIGGIRRRVTQSIQGSLNRLSNPRPTGTRPKTTQVQIHQPFSEPATPAPRSPESRPRDKRPKVQSDLDDTFKTVLEEPPSDNTIEDFMKNPPDQRRTRQPASQTASEPSEGSEAASSTDVSSLSFDPTHIKAIVGNNPGVWIRRDQNVNTLLPSMKRIELDGETFKEAKGIAPSAIRETTRADEFTENIMTQYVMTHHVKSQIIRQMQKYNRGTDIDLVEFHNLITEMHKQKLLADKLWRKV